GVLSGGAVAFQGLTTNLPILAGGGRHNANDILLDGVDDNLRNFNGKVGRAGLTYIPSVDAVEEFKVKTNSFSAEYGHSAGYTMNATIKSGGNQYHGSAYEFLRNDALDANSFVSNFSGKPKAEFRQNQFGATVGGPVRLPFYNGHDKTFFFGDYEGLQIRQAATSSLLDIPPAVFRAGDFSSSPTKIYDPATRVLGTNGVAARSEEHTSELQSRGHLVCRLLLEKKKGQVRTERRGLEKPRRHTNSRVRRADEILD